MSTNDTIKTVDDAFEWFEKNVARVDEQDNKDAKAVHPDIRKAACEAMPVEHHFLSGSYGRRVQAVKLKDIDVIVVLTDDDGAFGADARGTLLQVQDALRDCDLVRQARPPSVRSVKALLHDYEFHVDTVPAIRPTVGDGLYLTRNLPEEGYNDWTLEYPEQQLKACQDKNKSTNGLYVPATRVVRTWNQRYPTAKPLRSYHAESLLYHGIGDAKTLQDATVAFFDHAYAALAPGQLTATPGAPAGRYVDDKLSDEDRKAAREKVGKAREGPRRGRDRGPGQGDGGVGQGLRRQVPDPCDAPRRGRGRVALGHRLRRRGGHPRGPYRGESRDLIPGRSWSRS